MKPICGLSLDMICPSNHGGSWTKCETMKRENILCPYLEEKRKNIKKFKLIVGRKNNGIHTLL